MMSISLSSKICMSLNQCAYGLIMTLVAMAAVAEPQAYHLTPIRGQVVDRTTHLPLEGAVINAAWILDTVNSAQGAGVNYLYIQQVQSDKEGRFVVPVPAQPLSGAGLRLKIGSDPLITVYADRHRSRVLENGSRTRSGDFIPINPSGTHSPRWQWDSKVIPLDKFKADADGTLLATELATWRDNLETALNAVSWHGNVEAASMNQMLLLKLIQQECGHLAEIQRHEICTGRLADVEQAKAVPVTTGEPVINVIRIHAPTWHGAGSARPQ